MSELGGQSPFRTIPLEYLKYYFSLNDWSLRRRKLVVRETYLQGQKSLFLNCRILRGMVACAWGKTVLRIETGGLIKGHLGRSGQNLAALLWPINRNVTNDFCKAVSPFSFICLFSSSTPQLRLSHTAFLYCHEQWKPGLSKKMTYACSSRYLICV